MTLFKSTSPNGNDLLGRASVGPSPLTNGSIQNFSSSQASFQLLLGFFPEFDPRETHRLPDLLKPLAKELAAGKSLSQAYHSLSQTQQNQIQKRVGGKELQPILALSRETDEVLFWNQAQYLGQRLVAKDRLRPAIGVLGQMTRGDHGAPRSIQGRARLELNAITGKGSAGRRIEFLGGRFITEATSYKMIIPMFAGSMVGRLVQGAVWSRLGLAKGARWFQSAPAPKIISGTFGFAAEVSTFSLSSRGLRQLAGDPLGPFAQEFLGAGITLSLLKGFGSLGQGGFRWLHGVDELGAMTRLAGISRISRPLIPQAAMFTGLLGAHGLETWLGLRPASDGATLVTDTLATLFSLGIGARLGHRGIHSLVPEFQNLPEAIFSHPNQNEGTSNGNLEIREWLPGVRRFAFPQGMEFPNRIPSDRGRARTLDTLSLSEGSGKGGDGPRTRKIVYPWDMPIEDLRLSLETTETLKRMGLKAIREIVMFPESELKRYFFRREPKAVKEVLEILNKRGLTLGMKFEGYENRIQLLSIRILDLSITVHRKLRSGMGIKSIKQLLEFSERDLLVVGGFNHGQVLEIKESLRTHGQNLKGSSLNQRVVPSETPPPTKPKPSTRSRRVTKKIVREKKPEPPPEPPKPKPQTKPKPKPQLIPKPKPKPIPIPIPKPRPKPSPPSRVYPDSNIDSLGISKESVRKLKDRGEIERVKQLIKKSEWALKRELRISAEDLAIIKKLLKASELKLSDKGPPKNLLNRSLWEVGLSEKAQYALEQLKIYKVGELIKKSRKEVAKSPFIFKEYMMEIDEFLKDSGLKFQDD